MELISVHIPKTAGVTFRTLLRTVYGPSAVHLDYADRVLDPASAFQTDFEGWQTATHAQADRLPPETRVIHGHFSAIKYRDLFPEAKRVVWLRDPVARLVSHYHYWRNLPPTPHTLHRRMLDDALSLLEFARLEPMQNIVSRIFLRGYGVADFAFVGIQEDFTAEVRRLATLLGWPSDLQIGEENRNPRPDYQDDPLDESAHAEITRLNAEDIALYRQAIATR